MAMVAPAPPVLAGPVERIVGIDVARALAMLGMLIVHYASPDGSGAALDVVADLLAGRAMPLFVLLGGVGVSLSFSRPGSATGDLLRRAGILFILGLLLHEASIWVAVVLQSYGLFFAVAPILGRLSNRALLGAAIVIGAVGSVTYQTVGNPSQPTAFSDLLEPSSALTSLFFDGYYPFFPVAALFIIGMWLGRLDLRSDRVAVKLAAMGVGLGLGSIWMANRFVVVLSIDASSFGTNDDSFRLSRLVDHAGHSQMPAWMISAVGSSAAVLGLCLLVAPRLGALISPVVALGTLPLSFYALQVLTTRLVPNPRTTSFQREFIHLIIIYFGSMTFAYWWKRRFRSGPLETVLRAGSWSKREGRGPSATSTGADLSPDLLLSDGRPRTLDDEGVVIDRS